MFGFLLTNYRVISLAILLFAMMIVEFQFNRSYGANPCPKKADDIIDCPINGLVTCHPATPKFHCKGEAVIIHKGRFEQNPRVIVDINENVQPGTLNLNIPCYTKAVCIVEEIPDGNPPYRCIPSLVGPSINMRAFSVVMCP
jgi:hypothetical protein